MVPCITVRPNRCPTGLGAADAQLGIRGAGYARRGARRQAEIIGLRAHLSAMKNIELSDAEAEELAEIIAGAPSSHCLPGHAL